MRFAFVVLAIAIFSGCADKYNIEALPIKPANGAAVIVFIPDTFGGEIYQVKDGEDILLGKTGANRGDSKQRFVIAKAQSGEYLFKSKKHSDEVKISAKGGETLYLLQKQVWDLKSVVDVLVVPILAATWQKQTLAVLDKKDAEDALSKLRYRGETVIEQALEP
jgi:hypothetical protein